MDYFRRTVRYQDRNRGPRHNSRLWRQFVNGNKLKINEYKQLIKFEIEGTRESNVYSGKSFLVDRLEDGKFIGRVCVPRNYSPEALQDMRNYSPEVIRDMGDDIFELRHRRSAYEGVPVGQIIGEVYFQRIVEDKYILQSIKISEDIEEPKYLNLLRLFLRILGIEATSDGRRGTYLFDKRVKLKPGQQWSSEVDLVPRFLDFQLIPLNTWRERGVPRQAHAPDISTVAVTNDFFTEFTEQNTRYNRLQATPAAINIPAITRINNRT